MKTFDVTLNTQLTKVGEYPNKAAATGCSFRGVYIIAEYKRIVEVVGHMTLLNKEEGDGKVQAEVILSNEKGDKVLTIYDYKEHNKSAEEVTNWHIGGNYGKEEVISILTQLGFNNDELQYGN